MGNRVNFRARIHQTRPFGPNLVIIVLRHRMVTIQAVLNSHTTICKGDDGGPSQNMVRFVERLPRETLVWVEGILRPPESKGHEKIKSADVHDAEVEIAKVRPRRDRRLALRPLTRLRLRQLWVLAEVTSAPPFGVEEATRAVADENHPERAEGKPGIGLHVRMEHRPLSLRVRPGLTFARFGLLT